MSIKLTNLIFMTFLGVVVGVLILPFSSFGESAAVGGGIGLLIGNLLNLKTPPLILPDDKTVTDPLNE